MSDERITVLESHVTNVRIENARLAEILEHLSKTVDELTGAVKNLTAYMERGKGALWIFGVMSATAGGLISWGTTLIFQK